MKFWKLFLIIALVFAMGYDEDALGRGGRSGGGSRSSFGSSSRSSGSRSSGSKSSWGSSSRSPSRSSGWGSSSRSSSSSSRSSAKSKPVRSKADTAAYNKAKSSGTAYKSKAAATSAFKTKNAAKYKSTYATKPATRPTHIPQTTSSGGKTYNVTYNQQHGGYGYMGPSGSWMAYSMMADAVMMNTMMRRQSYYYDRPGSVAYARGGGSFLWIIGICFLVFICVIGIGAMVSNH